MRCQSHLQLHRYPWVTFRGLVAAAARACGKDPEQVELRSFDPSGLDPKARKGPAAAAPTSSPRWSVEEGAGLAAAVDLEAGLRDSYSKDHSQRPALRWISAATTACFRPDA